MLRRGSDAPRSLSFQRAFGSTSSGQEREAPFSAICIFSHAALGLSWMWCSPLTASPLFPTQIRLPRRACEPHAEPQGRRPFRGARRLAPRRRGRRGTHSRHAARTDGAAAPGGGGRREQQQGGSPFQRPQDRAGLSSCFVARRLLQAAALAALGGQRRVQPPGQLSERHRSGALDDGAEDIRGGRASCGSCPRGRRLPACERGGRADGSDGHGPAIDRW